MIKINNFFSSVFYPLFSSALSDHNYISRNGLFKPSVWLSVLKEHQANDVFYCVRGRRAIWGGKVSLQSAIRGITTVCYLRKEGTGVNKL
jgi:hypothetical protein